MLCYITKFINVFWFTNCKEITIKVNYQILRGCFFTAPFLIKTELISCYAKHLFPNLGFGNFAITVN